MLDRDEIIEAVNLQRRSYNLLRWLSAAISKRVIRFNRAHEYMQEAEAAEDWIKGHYLNLPPDCRPDADRLAEFARFFATYLTTSFDLVKQPDAHLTSPCGCWCRVCAYLTSASHLKAKKLSRRDKERARKIKAIVLQQLAVQHNTRLGQQQAEQLIDLKSLAFDVALLSYGTQLIERTRGRSAGPAVLALWREIAWNQTSPKKDFQLNAEDILRAEHSLVQTITGLQKASM